MQSAPFPPPGKLACGEAARRSGRRACYLPRVAMSAPFQQYGLPGTGPPAPNSASMTRPVYLATARWTGDTDPGFDLPDAGGHRQVGR